MNMKVMIDLLHLCHLLPPPMASTLVPSSGSNHHAHQDKRKNGLHVIQHLISILKMKHNTMPRMTLRTVAGVSTLHLLRPMHVLNSVLNSVLHLLSLMHILNGQRLMVAICANSSSSSSNSSLASS